MKPLSCFLKSLPVAMLAVSLPAFAQTTTWNGSVDANWSTAGNWSPGAPNPGDNLIFDGSTQTSPNNDLTAGTLFNNLTFAPTASPFTLGGNQILVQGTVQNDATNQLQTIGMNVVLTNAVVFNTVSNDLNAVSGNDIAVLGAVSGPGSLTKNGNSTLFLANGATYSGGTTVNAGRLVVSNNVGNVTLNGGAYVMNFRTYYINPTISLTADSSIGIDLPDNTEPVGVDFAGGIGSGSYKLTKVGQGLLRIVGTSINVGSIDVAEGTLGSLGGGAGGSVSVEPVHRLGTAPITVQNGAMLRIDDGGVVQNAITLMGGTGTASGGSANTGILRSSARNNGGSTTNFNYFTNTISVMADSTVGSYYNKMFISGNITGPGGFTKIGSSPLNISGTNDFGGALIVSAGTLQLGSSAALPSGATNSYVQIAGTATLDLNGNYANCNGFVDDGAGTANLDNSSATPATLTVGNNNTSATFYGAVKNTGGGALSLVFVGSGSASFLGVNSYTGSNVVQSGTLDINIPTGTTTGGLVAVADNAALTLHRTTPGSSLKASGATIGTSGSTTLNIDLKDYGNPSLPVINATNGSGVLNANGTITINFNNTANMSVGQFPIIKYTTRTGNGSFVLTPISGITAQIVTNAGNKSIDLQITSAPITTWKGKTNDNLWDTTTTNWTYSGSPVLYSDGSAVFFDDTALTNNVNLTTTLAPGSVLINSTSNYVFGGSGSLSGGALTKNGSGTLILDVKGNTHASTTIAAGILQVGNNDNNGDLGSGPVVDEATLTFNLTNNYSVPGVISGGGVVVKNNTNTITLSQANTFSGGTLVNTGVLKLGNNTALGVPVGAPTGLAATVASGAALDLGGKLVSNGYISISGNGLDANTGALMTSAGMGCTIGCGGVGAKFLRLAGNATIGDNSGDFLLGADGNANASAAGVGGLDGQGFSLVKVGNNTVVLDVTNVTALSQFVIGGGQVIFANTGKTPIGTTAALVISNNAFMDSWDNFANSGITVPNNIVIGAGGGQLWNTRGMFYGRACVNTYSGSLTLNATLALRNTSTYGGAPNNVATSGTMTFSGPISGIGGISCTNGNAYTAGGVTTINTVTLSGTNTYSGQTVVNQGVVQLSSVQQGGGAYLVYDNSTLDVPLQTGGFSNVPMSTLMLGSASGGTLNLGRVTTLSTVTAPIMATNLTVIGTNAVLLPPIAYASAPGVYPLIKYVTGPTGYGTTGLIAIGGGVRGVPGYITNDTAQSQIALVIPGGTPVVWTGAGGNSWDINTTISWVTNLVATTYQQTGSLGDAVTFDDSSSVTNVNITVPVKPTAAIFNITNKTYMLIGTNITGSASLVKNGPGTLVLSNFNNNFTSGTFVGNGTLKMATSLNPLVALNNLSGTLTVASGATFDMGSNNPTAMIINASGAGVGGNGAIQANYSGAGQGYGPSIINLQGNTTIGGNNRLDLRNGSKTLNVVSNGYSLTKVGSGYVGLVAATVSTNLGDITILGGTLSYQTSTAGLGNTNNTIYVGTSGTLGFYAATVPLFKPIVFTNSSILVESGNSVGQNVISGPVTLASGTTTVKGNFYNGLYFSNNISGPGSFALQFQSYVYLCASNSFTGTVTVPNCNGSNGGRGTRLSLLGNGSISKASQIYIQGIAPGQAFAGWIALEGRPDATLTLGGNQLFRGDNGSYVRGSVVAPATSAIAPGGINNSNYQYMIIGTNLTFQSGSTNYMDVFKTASLLTNDLIMVSNLVTYAGTLVIRTNGSVAVTNGDSFKLFQAASSTGNFASIVDDSGATWSFNPATGVATVLTAPPTVNTGSTNITTSVSGNQLTMEWPADHIGWTLQSNSISLINTSAWFAIPGSTTTNKIIITFDPSLTNVFYRMKY